MRMNQTINLHYMLLDMLLIFLYIMEWRYICLTCIYVHVRKPDFTQHPPSLGKWGRWQCSWAASGLAQVSLSKTQAWLAVRVKLADLGVRFDVSALMQHLSSGKCTYCTFDSTEFMWQMVTSYLADKALLKSTCYAIWHLSNFFFFFWYFWCH